MKSKPIVGLLVALVMSACEQKAAPNKVNFPIIEATSKDVSQSEPIRKSAGIFLDILSEKQGLLDRELMSSHGELVRLKNTTTINTYVEFLKSLEKKIPDKLPPTETYLAMENKAGQAKIIEYNVAQTVIMISNSVRNITLYNDPKADQEVEGVLSRLREKHGTSETGKKILELLNTVHSHGLGDRAHGIKPWDSPEPGSSS